MHTPLRIVMVGHVDHGKSTLLARLLHDCGCLPDGAVDAARAASTARGNDDFEWAYVLDAFQAERDQAVTIDITRRILKANDQSYVLIDAPGHREFLRNMVTGASDADAAILVVDATEGVCDQTRRHALLVQLLGVCHVIVAVNKMDAIDYDSSVFDRIAADMRALLAGLDLAIMSIIPVAARHGVMVRSRGDEMGWYDGPTIAEALGRLTPPPAHHGGPLRFIVQDIDRRDGQRVIVGRVDRGTIRVGDRVLLSPLNETTTVDKIVVWPNDHDHITAQAGDVVGLVLSDRVFVERGHVISHGDHGPFLSNVFRARLVWLGDADVRPGDVYTVRVGTRELVASVQAIERVVTADDLTPHYHAASAPRHAVVDMTLRAQGLMVLDAGHDGGGSTLSRLCLYDGPDLVAGGGVDVSGYLDQRVRPSRGGTNLHTVHGLVTAAERTTRMGHRGGVFWLTGLSGAGKSTLAMRVERALFDRGFATYVLDGDNVRGGLTADLGFSPADRSENNRRVAAVAGLMADAGLVVLSAFISPFRADRARARGFVPAGAFHEIYVRADLATCELRDPKGLYKKARIGQIADFTGIDSPYEEPENPDMVVDTQTHDIDHCVRMIVDYVIAKTKNEKA
ncbi:adenylyl-sulfate kinase [Micavibrio aeruginosavorus]|uniref:Adenylyl-sulfate kinase n=1 Tax=Micavibrio aeruginosavorus EPB TaxID=349215 RepID=M4VHU6_9BACT|nr:adenylyl-sulfate kinase [Micavibrio aeruginosavorus]AGH98778.1 Adenylylsulfate kinase [Micavibrio aeruginosavorus EPB]